MANAELRRLESTLAKIHAQGRCARLLLASSAETGELVDRIAGLEEMTIADRAQQSLLVKIDAATLDAQDKRQELLIRRVARRQVETLVEAKSAEARVEADRKSQSALDDWHRAQHLPEAGKANTHRSESDNSLTD